MRTKFVRPSQWRKVSLRIARNLRLVTPRRVVSGIRFIAAWSRRNAFLPRDSWQRLAVAIGAGLIVIASCGSIIYDHIFKVPSGAVFRIDSTVVSEQQLTRRMKLLNVLYGITPPPPSDAAKMDDYRRDSAKAVAVSMVLDNAARDKGIAVADKKANDYLTSMINQANPQGDNAFTQKLESVGLSREEVVAEIKRQLADAELYQQVTSQAAAPTDQDITQYYEQHKSQIARPETRHLRNIVLATQDQAEQVCAQLTAGADFTAVAAHSSLDDSTKTKGGDLGSVTRDQLDPTYAAAAFAAPPNAVYGPVKTQYGWNVGQVLEVAPPTPLTLDQARDQLRALISDTRKQDIWNKWLDAQVKAAHVRYSADYRPADPDSATPGTTSPPIPK